MSLPDSSFYWVTVAHQAHYVHAKQPEGDAVEFTVHIGDEVGLRPGRPGEHDRWLLKNGSNGDVSAVSINTAAAFLQERKGLVNPGNWLEERMMHESMLDSRLIASAQDVRPNLESSVLACIGYWPQVELLLIRFNSGGWWAYPSVPVGTWNDILKEKSVGSAYSKHVKGYFDSFVLHGSPQDELLDTAELGFAIATVARKDLKGDFSVTEFLTLP
jgi:hypothetical protein